MRDAARSMLLRCGRLGLGRSHPLRSEPSRRAGGPARRSRLAAATRRSLIAGLALGVGAACAPDPAAASGLDQAPILRVLRPGDLPTFSDEELPSGALTAPQLTYSNDPTTTGRRAETSMLMRNGFRSAAISEFAGPGHITLKSIAIELSSPALAARVLRGEARLCAATQAPGGTRVTVAVDHVLAHAIIVTFHPAGTHRDGGLELLARSGSYVYTLRGVDEPDAVSRSAIERLLSIVIDRA